jgi:hypothetical protein
VIQAPVAPLPRKPPSGSEGSRSFAVTDELPDLDDSILSHVKHVNLLVVEGEFAAPPR